MNESKFNVIDQPWILVKDVDGALKTVSMRELFKSAHRYECLAGELPSQDFAVLRILLAVLYRVFDAEDHDSPTEEWGEIWERSDLPVDEISEYLDKWYDRFYLFDDAQPWLQVADLESISGSTKPVDLLIPDCPIEGGLFSMRRDYESITPAEAARWLAHCHAYDISGIKTGAVGDGRVKGGKGYPIGTGWAGWLGGIVVTGNNLRETLLLNLVFDRKHDERDVPIWEEPPLTSAPRENAQVYGPVALFTWPQRRIRLFQNSAGNVSDILICNGDPIAYQFQDSNEVMCGWRLSTPQSKKFGQDVYMPRQFDPSETLWRGFNALLPTSKADASNEDFKSCAVIEWSANLALDDILPKTQVTKIKTVGAVYGPQSASWEEIFSDELAFNVLIASSESNRTKEVVYLAAERAAEAAKILGRLGGNLAIAAGGDPDSASTDARSFGFSELDNPFRNWLADFSPSGDVNEQLAAWTSKVYRLIRNLAAQLVENASPEAWVGRSVTQNNTTRVYSTGQAEVWFHHALQKALPRPSTKQEVNA